MNLNLNSIILEGTVLFPPDLIRKDSGDITLLTVQHLREVTDSDGNTYEASTTVKVHTTQALACTCAESIHKGSLVRVVGRIFEYADLNAPFTTIRIHADHIELKPTPIAE